ncbi:MAG: hypothetical protein AAGA75_15810 [Cyanobacteria bacterium P01_E01_bin.6]
MGEVAVLYHRSSAQRIIEPSALAYDLNTGGLLTKPTRHWFGNPPFILSH